MCSVGMDVHAEDGCTASDIQHHLVLENVLVLVDGISVRLGADFILQHLFVNAMVVVAVEVVHLTVGEAGERI